MKVSHITALNRINSGYNAVIILHYCSTFEIKEPTSGHGSPSQHPEMCCTRHAFSAARPTTYGSTSLLQNYDWSEASQLCWRKLISNRAVFINMGYVSNVRQMKPTISSSKRPLPTHNRPRRLTWANDKRRLQVSSNKFSNVSTELKKSQLNLRGKRKGVETIIP